MKKCAFRVCAALLSLLIGCVPMRQTAFGNLYAFVGRDIPENPPAHTALSFSELPFLPTDPALLTDRIARLSARVDAGEGTPAGWQTELESLYGMLGELESDAALAYVRHCLDTEDAAWASRAERLETALDGLYASLNGLALRLSELPDLKRRYSPQTLSAIQKAARLYDPSVQPLLIEEQRILAEYDALCTSFSIEYEGERWDEQRISADRELPFAEWYAIRQAFDTSFSQEAGTLYLELISLRRQIADALGFSDVSSYRYALYDRDYTPAQAAGACEAARDRLAPLYRRVQKRTAEDREILMLAMPKRSEGEWLAAVREVIESVDPALCEPWEYMVSHGMLDVSRSETKLPGSYTTYFSTYGAPFLYLTWEDSYADPLTLLHEFGHYASYYFRGDAADALDLAETDSQGLELLAIPAYDRLFGNRADEAKAVKLCDMLYAILSGCACDAFEQAAYDLEQPNYEQLCTLFERLCRDYGLDTAGFAAATWTRIPHLFRAPGYYISYASGAIGALSLYAVAIESPTRAARAYRTLLTRKNSERRGVLRRCGLTDFLSDDTIARIAELYEE